MKFYILIIIFVFTACSKTPQANKSSSENIKAKNKEIALSNEISSITRETQKLEKQGRGMEIFRQANNAENQRECNVAMEDGKKQLKDLKNRIVVLPDNYKNQLMPLLADLDECVSCAKKALESCVKSRASINKTIKEIYPQ